jgi:hypothetical protein
MMKVLDDFKETRIFSELKEFAPVHSLWMTRSSRRCGTVLRQTK